MGVQKSAYRQPVTPEGLRAIEEGTLTWLDDEMYNNFNTGLLEQYLEEKNIEEGFRELRKHWISCTARKWNLWGGGSMLVAMGL